MEFLNSSEDCVDLESEAPSLRFSIVFLQHVDVLASKVLPISNRFFDPFGFRNFLSEYLKEGGLATSDVALDGEAIVFGGELWVECEIFRILIQTSR